MKYLLDTSVFLWSLGADQKLNAKAVEILSSTASELYLSAASSWEIAIKFALGSLKLQDPPSQFIPRGMQVLALNPMEITHSHALAAGELPRYHRDPFDRVLIAQSRAEQLVLLTGDAIFKTYDVETIFCRK